MESLTTAPTASSFVPLAVHQSRTPSSFHSGPAILHYHSTGCKLVILERELAASSLLSSLRPQPSVVNGHAPTSTAAADPDTEIIDGEDKEIVVDGLDIWVTSDKFLLYNPSLSTGISIPYPSISLHAIQRLQLPPVSNNDLETTQSQVQGLYMQIVSPSSASSYPRDNDDEECITMTLVQPPRPAPDSVAAEEKPAEGGEGGDEEEEEDPETETPTQKLYAAVSACSNLHPDPVEEDEEAQGGLLQSGLISMGNREGGLPPPMEGSGGWITADNMHEFFDADGNWIGGGEEPSLSLGPGAGTVRQREDGDDQDEDEDMDSGADETKWRRTD